MARYYSAIAVALSLALVLWAAPALALDEWHQPSKDTYTVSPMAQQPAADEWNQPLPGYYDGAKGGVERPYYPQVDLESSRGPVNEWNIHD